MRNRPVKLAEGSVEVLSDEPGLWKQDVGSVRLVDSEQGVNGCRVTERAVVRDYDRARSMHPTSLPRLRVGPG